MSVGGFVGALAGGVIGFVVGGPVGAAIGMGIGTAAGMMIDPLTPNANTGMTPTEMNVPSAKHGIVVAEVLGTIKAQGNILWYGKERSVEQKQDTGGGKGGGSQETVTGYEYHLSWAVGLCFGPADKLLAVYRADSCVWSGELDRPAEGGCETITLRDMGSLSFYFGTSDQAINEVMAEEAGDIVPAYRHQVYAFFDDCYIGNYNRMPRMSFIIQRSPELGFNSKEIISIYDYNPAHAIWYILTEMTSLDNAYLDATSFSAAADLLYNENRGVSIYFGAQRNAMDYIEGLLQHVNGILNWDTDGSLHLSLIRPDVEVDDMLVVTEDDILDDLQLNRKSWLDTVNEVKIQYAHRFWRGEQFCECEGTPVLSLDSTEARWCHLSVSDACPPYKVYRRYQSGDDWGPWVLIRITEGDFVERCETCGGTPTQVKVVNNNDVESNVVTLVGCHCPETVEIGYTTLQMSASQQQTLTANNIPAGCLPELVTWELYGGTGTLSETSGLSTQYTAPASNVNCANNPTIRLFCCGNLVDSVTFAINTVHVCENNPEHGFAVTKCCSCTGDPTHHCVVFYRCDGLIAATGDACCQTGQNVCQYLSCGDCSGLVGCTVRNWDTCENGPFAPYGDVREPEALASGCCPYQLI